LRPFTTSTASPIPAGRLFVTIGNGGPTKYDVTLNLLRPGSAVFAHENGRGIVALGRVANRME
jgi:hypothetical protein